MAFLRFTRDKRGYEHFALVQPTTRRGKSTSRLLYWYRTPPDIKLGREPFDEGVRRELEARYPDVTFDWRKILETPIPSADAEKWRERRRAERAERAARQALDREDDDQNGAEAAAEAPAHVIEVAAEASASTATDVEVRPDPVVPGAAGGSGPASETESRRRRHRRRRGRRGKHAGQTSADTAAPRPIAGDGHTTDQDE